MLDSCHDLYLSILLGLEIIHNNRFDYSHDSPDCDLPIFEALNTKLDPEPTYNQNLRFKAYCPHCAKYFWTNLHQHLTLGLGCLTCPTMYQDSCREPIGSKAKALRTELFIKKAKVVHGDKYNYSLAYYERFKVKLLIRCPEHGLFWQTPDSHIANHGCPKCANEANGDNHRSNTEEFIRRAKIVHPGDKYDYSRVDYINSWTKVCIICQEHGQFAQIPDSHLRGTGCRLCGILSSHNSRRSNTEAFIRRAKIVHPGDKYDYSKVDYTDNATKVEIICPEHGQFAQTPDSHLSSKGCQLCANKANGDSKRSNTEAFIRRAKIVHPGDKYDYSKVDYTDNATKVEIICPEHGLFWQKAHNHLSGNGCPSCNKGGFDKALGGTLYQLTIKIWDSDFSNTRVVYKIGITNHDVGRRYQRDRCLFQIMGIREIDYEKGEEAASIERYLINKYQDSRLVSPIRIFEFTGNTEVFNIDIFAIEGLL